MKVKATSIALGSFLALAACDKPADEAPADAKPAAMDKAAAPAGAPGAPGAPGAQAANANAAAAPNAAQAAAAATAAEHEKQTKELQAKLDGVTTKMEALKQKAEAPEPKKGKKNKAAEKQKAQLKEELTAMNTKLEAAKTELKGLATVPEAGWADAKSKTEKSIQELELSLEQATGRGVN